MAAGVLAGVLASFALAAALRRCGRGAAILFGALSLPVGAFLFGVLLSLVQWLVREFTGTAYPFVAYEFAPIKTGAQYALLSVISVLAFILFPLAVGTTLLLRRVVHSGHSHEHT